MDLASSLDRPRVNVLGVGVDAVDMKGVTARIIDAVLAARGGYVCVTGVHGVMEAQRDPRLRQVLNRSLVTTPDGMPMVWLGRLAGFHSMRRVYGPDLMLALCAESVNHGLTHFLYGGNDGVAEQLAERLRARYPGIKICGTYTPPFRPLNAGERRALAARVRALRPDFFWVGLSTPKQELFMAENQGEFGSTLMLGVGAAFDMHSGRTKQAPRWMQQTGFEWLFRLLQEPRRLFGRYARNNPAFVVRVFEQKLGFRRYVIES